MFAQCSQWLTNDDFIRNQIFSVDDGMALHLGTIQSKVSIYPACLHCQLYSNQLMIKTHSAGNTSQDQCKGVYKQNIQRVTLGSGPAPIWDGKTSKLSSSLPRLGLIKA